MIQLRDCVTQTELFKFLGTLKLTKGWLNTLSSRNELIPTPVVAPSSAMNLKGSRIFLYHPYVKEYIRMIVDWKKEGKSLSKIHSIMSDRIEEMEADMEVIKYQVKVRVLFNDIFKAIQFFEKKGL